MLIVSISAFSLSVIILIYLMKDNLKQLFNEKKSIKDEEITELNKIYKNKESTYKDILNEVKILDEVIEEQYISITKIKEKYEKENYSIMENIKQNECDKTEKIIADEKLKIINHELDTYIIEYINVNNNDNELQKDLDFFFSKNV